MTQTTPSQDIFIAQVMKEFQKKRVKDALVKEGTDITKLTWSKSKKGNLVATFPTSHRIQLVLSHVAIEHNLTFKSSSIHEGRFTFNLT